jgi:hypothetical protein
LSGIAWTSSYSPQHKKVCNPIEMPSLLIPRHGQYLGFAKGPRATLSRQRCAHVQDHRDRLEPFQPQRIHHLCWYVIDELEVNPKLHVGDTMIKFWSIENSLKCKHTMKTNARITSAYFHPEGTTMIGYSQSSDSIRYGVDLLMGSQSHF